MIYNIVLIKCYFTYIPNKENKRKQVISMLLERFLEGVSHVFLMYRNGNIPAVSIA